MRRRKFIGALGGAAGVGIAGCLGDGDDGGDGTPGDGSDGTDGGENGDGTPGDGSDNDESNGDDTPTDTQGTPTEDPLSGTLTVATYEAFVDAPSTSPGNWVKEAFESEYDDVTLEWETPENDLNYFVQRHNSGVDLDADVYVGLNVDDLVTVDEALEGDRLLRELDRDAMENVDRIRDGLEFDPDGRAIPYDTGYISLVYDENEVEEPATFDTLLEPEYEGTLLAQNAQTSDPGRAFMLWTIAEMGEDEYLDYWRGLVDNDVRIFGSWSDSYAAYSEGERPIVVSYSTDQVFASQNDEDMSRHQIAFPNDQGYANPEGMAVFEGTDQPELATEFLDWMLGDEPQAEIAERNVQYPAIEDVDLDEEFAQYAHEPPEPVTFSYDELAGNLNDWIDEWAREIAGN